ncbi:serine hydrolase domain-containing protein [Sinosporangium album]|uniref:serine hydrolase domain-containing protein n=1 Tax=Sinosporangium album TaxID=504805 RepID=UPI001FE1C821|nr:serine hydrolase domain-containing protein [Sinosporangium album]
MGQAGAVGGGAAVAHHLTRDRRGRTVKTSGDLRVGETVGQSQRDLLAVLLANYVLARLVVEKVTDRSLGEEMQRLILGPLGLTGTVVPDTSTDVPEPHAHAYYRYEEDGQEKVVDVTRQNPSWISTGGDMISTTRDLATFISALVGGRLLLAELLAEMCTPEPKAGYGLGVFVQDVPGGGTVITHNGGITGHAGLMYSTPDGGKILTASLNYVDDAALSMGEAFQKTTQRLVAEIFGGGRAASAL